MKKIRVGIIGGAGYTGGELIRLLVHHTEAQIVFVHSKSNGKKPIYSVHTDLLGDTDLFFSDTVQYDIDVLFLCVAHGEAKQFLQQYKMPDRVKIVDLSQDYRLLENNENQFVYGLPELNKDKIQNATYIANPGCFATCIQLALLPLAHNNMLQSDIHISATTGSTGAGQSLSGTSHFSWRSNNLSVYKPFEHQHLSEIKQSITQLQSNFGQDLHFIPHRGNFSRGILATTYVQCPWAITESVDCFQKYYSNHPFVFVSEEAVDLKQVVNTNKCLIHLQKHGNKLLITTVIDNLLKGASGQAVQNMNLLFGLEETTGLKLKASAF